MTMFWFIALYCAIVLYKKDKNNIDFIMSRSWDKEEPIKSPIQLQMANSRPTDDYQ